MLKTSLIMFVCRVCMFALLIIVFNMGCNKDKPTSPKESYCDRLSIEYGEPSFDFQCTSISGTVSYSYDSDGNYATIEMDYECTDSGEDYKVKFYNIKRNIYGNAVEFDATINGENCHYP